MSGMKFHQMLKKPAPIALWIPGDIREWIYKAAAADHRSVSNFVGNMVIAWARSEMQAEKEREKKPQEGEEKMGFKKSHGTPGPEGKQGHR